MGKINATPVTYFGITFRSTHEGNRYLVLKSMQDAGEIRDLQYEAFTFELIPAQPDMKERKTEYTPDMTYYEKGNDKMVVEEVKGYWTTDGRIKWKLFIFQHKHEFDCRVIK